MTMLLKNTYESKPLHLIPTSILTSQNYLPLLTYLRETQASIPYYITYPAFASLSSKSDTLTLRDIYLKMLMCTRGVTGEKALEIQKIWRTPRELLEAFEQYSDNENGRKRKRELIFEKMGDMVGRKKVGKVLSAKISEVWT